MPFGVAGGEADQRIADMADRAVGHQPLDVLLRDRGDRAEHHRGDRQKHDDLAPFDQQAAERLDHEAHEQRERRDLRRDREERGDRGRRALVDIGGPHMERHRRYLEGEADRDKDEADDQPGRRRRAAAEQSCQSGEARSCRRTRRSARRRKAACPRRARRERNISARPRSSAPNRGRSWRRHKAHRLCSSRPR